ncbi:Uncharacterised protein [Segatella copri]|nr:Uncharacterised protein [Segatella copri]
MRSGCSLATVGMRFTAGRMFSFLRRARTASTSFSMLVSLVFNTKRPIWKSEKPNTLASRNTSAGISSRVLYSESLCL